MSHDPDVTSWLLKTAKNDILKKKKKSTSVSHFINPLLVSQGYSRMAPKKTLTGVVDVHISKSNFFDLHILRW